MLYVGIDQHKRTSYFCCLNEDGRVVKERNLVNDSSVIETFLSQLPDDELTAVLEVGSYWGVMHDTLEELDLVDNIKLAHPQKLKAFASANKKTDKIDAHLLAELLRRDQIPEVWIQTKTLRVQKNVARFRLFLVRERTRIKNRIHNIASRNHLNTPEVSDLFGKYGREWLNTVDLPEEERFTLDCHLDFLDFIESQIKKIEKYLNKLFKDDEEVKLLKTIPGIGNILAVVLKLEIGDINRFSTVGKFHCYSGLIPSIYSSARITRYGRLVKNSNKYIRWALVEAAQIANRHSINFKRIYDRIAARKNKKTAVIVVARKLASTLFYMLKRKEKYSENRKACSPSPFTNA
ncbi:MAG: IS110 family transposase [Kosmotogaceae bacterium]